MILCYNFFAAILSWAEQTGTQFSARGSEGSGKNKKNLDFSYWAWMNGLKIIYFIQTWPSDIKKLKTDRCTRTEPSEKLSTWLLSSGQDFGKNFLDSKHVLKVYFKPSRQNGTTFKKPTKIIKIQWKVTVFEDIFRVCLILLGKQQPKPIRWN